MSSLKWPFGTPPKCVTNPNWNGGRSHRARLLSNENAQVGLDFESTRNQFAELLELSGLGVSLPETINEQNFTEVVGTVLSVLREQHASGESDESPEVPTLGPVSADSLPNTLSNVQRRKAKRLNAEIQRRLSRSRESKHRRLAREAFGRK